jgi:hypothetical protein
MRPLKRAATGSLMLLLTAALPATAERFDEARTDATLVVVGRVMGVQKSRLLSLGSVHTDWVLAITVESVDKGQGSGPGEVLSVRVFRNDDIGPVVPLVAVGLVAVATVFAWNLTGRARARNLRRVLRVAVLTMAIPMASVLLAFAVGSQAGMRGHRYIPQEGERVRAYLKGARDGHEPIYPDWADRIPA